MRHVFLTALFGLLVAATSARSEDGMTKLTGKLKSISLKRGSFILDTGKKEIEIRTTPDTKFLGPDMKPLKNGLTDKAMKTDIPLVVIAGEKDMKAKEVRCGIPKPDEPR
jgi:hypothetical protein